MIDLWRERSVNRFQNGFYGAWQNGVPLRIWTCFDTWGGGGVNKSRNLSVLKIAKPLFTCHYFFLSVDLSVWKNTCNCVLWLFV
jgi:hypothetical protein